MDAKLQAFDWLMARRDAGRTFSEDVESLAGLLGGRWQPIETAPKGGGAKLTTDPKWAEPPKILMLFEDGNQCVVHWDAYYAEGGRGCIDGCAWVEPVSGELAHLHFGMPTHWMPLPEPPK